MNMESRLLGIHAEKDINSVFISCNSAFVECAGYKKVDELIGKSDIDMPWAEYSSIYRKHEEDALQGQYYNTVIPLKDSVGGLALYLHTKLPRKDADGNIIGLIGHAVEIFNPDAYALIDLLSQKATQKVPVFTMNKKLTDVPLSAREEECLLYLALGKTAKAISEILSLSCRTIESYIENIKSKLHCRTKMELIDFAIQHGFLESLPTQNSVKQLLDKIKT